ncbi:hypothetical protein ASG66_14795 [Bacillus sp. Leaf406]|nr:hypothetical protein ASG66_14795 [Bacillus sp. Leaf406]
MGDSLLLHPYFDKKRRVEWSGRCLTPAEKEDDRDPAGTRRLDMLPAESKHLKRKGTVLFKIQPSLL